MTATTQKINFIFNDVPPELVYVLNAIKFPAIEESVQQQRLMQLQRFADGLASKGQMTLRTNNERNGKAGKFKVRASIPQFAADILNRYEYPAFNVVKRNAMKAAALAFLKNEGIPLYSTDEIKVFYNK